MASSPFAEIVLSAGIVLEATDGLQIVFPFPVLYLWHLSPFDRERTGFLSSYLSLFLYSFLVFNLDSGKKRIFRMRNMVQGVFDNLI